MRRIVATAALVACAFAGGRARAGGFEIPDNGTEAIGRGGAFTAKADDPTAIQYNIAGLARQRGTRLLLDAHVLLNDYQFQRAGTYVDDPKNPQTPWGGTPYPLVTNAGGPFLAPFLALTSDLGLDRWTFALGAYGPSTVGNRTYPLGVAGAPSPGRYDVAQIKGVIALPTAAVGFRAMPWLDVGVALHYVYGTFDLTSVSYSDLGPPLCPGAEYQPCDARTNVQASGSTVTGAAGALARPMHWLAVGLNVRGPATIDATGTASAIAPKAAPLAIAPAAAEFKTSLPWVVRGGVRLIELDKDFEEADVELDATYETWGSAQGDGPQVSIPQLGTFTNINTTILHHYKDTISVRLGGAYNFPFVEGTVFSLRAGAYYDQSATDPQSTRLDFDTLDKYAGTLGVGLRFSGVQLNLGYAEVFESSRTVTNGELRPLNGIQHGQSLGASGQPLPVVNNGDYTGHTRIFSFGAVVMWDELLGGQKRDPPSVTEK